MKKVKNTELNKTIASSEKIKNKKAKKLKDAVTNLAPKIEQTSEPSKNNGEAVKSKKKNKKHEKKVTHQHEKQVISEDQTSKAPQIVANNENQAEKKKKKKAKKEKLQKSKLTANVVPMKTENHKELTEADLKKIEKKKAKKLAQKLKKQQKLKNASETNMDSPKTNGVKNEKPADNDSSTSTKVLTKKEKKAKKRQLIKEQKLAEKQTRDPTIEAATVFVGNLPVNTKRVQLISLFKDYTPINSIRLRSAGGKVLHKHKQRKEAGSLNAYIVLKDKETAEKAVSLNGIEFKGNHLRITLASKSSLHHHEKDEGKRTVFVGNLKYSATEEALREVFSSCGEIEYVRCLRDGDKGCKGVAYVCFKTPDSVGLALELNETMLDERPIHVERFSVKKLGAKEIREALSEKEKASKKGAKQRIDGNKAKQKKSAQKINSKITEDNDDKKPKKSEFRGVKVEALKKKQKLKKKKSNNQMLELAKKIAPKPKAV